MSKIENWILPECKVDGYVPVAFFYKNGTVELDFFNEEKGDFLSEYDELTIKIDYPFTIEFKPNIDFVKKKTMKKIIISSIFAIGVMFSGCDGNTIKSNYEDKELTKVFIKNNKDKLKQIHYIDTFWDYKPSFGEMGNNLNTTNIGLSFLSIKPDISRRIINCDYVMYIDSSTVEFLEDDIVHYGKEYMYKEAQKCLNTTLQLIDEEQKAKIEQEVANNERNIKLNKKFNENEVK